MTAYYNEIEPYAAQWLRNLITADQIAPGEVDERSIADVVPDDLRRFTQCHFFAGVGVWSYALRRAGWGDDRPVWTGSCPCQPFSAAGRGEGFADERHLWPAFHHLIAQRRPPVVFGEQVASKAVDPWIDLVQDDMEGLGYAFGAVPFPSAGVGAPHIRDRAYFMAYANGAGSCPRQRHDPSARHGVPAPADRFINVVDDAVGAGLEGQRCGHPTALGHGQGSVRPASEAGELGRLADATLGGRGEERPNAGGLALGDRTEGLPTGSFAGGGNQRPGPTNGFWRDPDWLHCRDGRWRPVEPGTFPLASGAPSRVGRLRAYGNAINAEAAAAFIAAAMECMP